MRQYVGLTVAVMVWLSFVAEGQAWRRPKNTTLRLKKAGVVRVGRQPKQIAVSPDHTIAYVTNFGGKSISVLNVRTFRVIKTMHTGGAPVEIAFTPNGKFVYITNFDKVVRGGPRAGIWKIDTSNHKIVAKIAGHRYPKGVVVSPDGKLVYFSSWWWPHGHMAVVSVKTNKIVRKSRVWNRPRGMAMSPDGKILYLCNFGEFYNKKDRSDMSYRKGAGLAFIDTKTLKRKRLVYGGYLTRHVSVSPDGKTIYVSYLGSSTLVAMDARTGRITKRRRVGVGPKTIDLSSDGRYLFSANYYGHSVSVLDTKTFREIERLRLPDRLSGLDVSPDDKYVYVTGWDTKRAWRLKIIRHPKSAARPTTKKKRITALSQTDGRPGKGR